MADTADTAAIMANMPNTANISAQDRREADTSSAEAVRNSAVANREGTATGVAVIGVAIGGIIDSLSTDSSRSADLVIRTTTGTGTPNGAGARLTTAILTGIILRMGTIITVAPYQGSDSLGPDRRAIRAYERSRSPHDRKTRIRASCERL
jgi:hypothetical protein